MTQSFIIGIYFSYYLRTKWKRSTSLGLELLSERLNYSALHGLRHGGSMGAGIFGTPHFLSGYNRSMMTTNPMQSLTTSNMILYNSSNNLRPFQIPTSSSSPLHHLSSSIIHCLQFFLISQKSFQ